MSFILIRNMYYKLQKTELKQQVWLMKDKM